MVNSILKIATIKVPLWVSLILVAGIVYLLNRPIPERVETKVEYKTQYQPPIIRKTLPPARLVNYSKFPVDQLRVDTIYVPVEMHRYQLWQPENVHRTRNSVVVRSYDVSEGMYRDYHFTPIQPLFRTSIEAYALYPMRIGLDATLYRGNLGVFGRIETGELPYYGGGIKYKFR